MTQEEKELLLKDLCARLPYGVKCAVFDKTLLFGGFDGKYPFEMDGITIEEDETIAWLEKANFNIETVKPYLRPMSSMTHDEDVEYKDIMESGHYDSPSQEYANIIDWLNEHHFDFRNLIGKGLALEAPEGMYKTE